MIAKNNGDFELLAAIVMMVYISTSTIDCSVCCSFSLAAQQGEVLKEKNEKEKEKRKKQKEEEE